MQTPVPPFVPAKIENTESIQGRRYPPWPNLIALRLDKRKRRLNSQYSRARLHAIHLTPSLPHAVSYSYRQKSGVWGLVKYHPVDHLTSTTILHGEVPGENFHPPAFLPVAPTSLVTWNSLYWG